MSPDPNTIDVSVSAAPLVTVEAKPVVEAAAVASAAPDVIIVAASNLGPPGAPGPPATIYQGMWDPATQYDSPDSVTYGNGLYLAEEPSMGIVPGTDDCWQEFLVGPPGPPGADGAPGPPGIGVDSGGATGQIGVWEDADTIKGSSALTQDAKGIYVNRDFIGDHSVGSDFHGLKSATGRILFGPENMFIATLAVGASITFVPGNNNYGAQFIVREDGAVLSTPLELPADPAQPTHAATKRYVDNKAATPGPAGPAGADGAPGPEGDPGPAGVPTFTDSGDPPYDPPPKPGDIWQPGTPSDGYMVNTGDVDTPWAGAYGKKGDNGTPVWRGDWINSTEYVYRPGDAVAYQGQSWVANQPCTGAGGQEPGGAFNCWNLMAQKGAPGPGTPTLVAVLPSSPIDGQEIYVLANATKGVMWRFRYRAASASQYKWEFVGGPALSWWGSGGTINSAGSYVAITASRLTVPFAGEYVARTAANVLSSDGTARSYSLGIEINLSFFMATDSGPYNGYGTQIFNEPLIPVGAGQSVGLMANSDKGTYRSCSLAITPVRIG